VSWRESGLPESGYDLGFHAGRSPQAKPAVTSSHPTPASSKWFDRLTADSDLHSAYRRALLFRGAIRAWGRWAVTRGIRAPEFSDRCLWCSTAATDRLFRLAA
jgi:hypothetical protein